VQKTFAEVRSLIGYPVRLEPEWSLLWTELQSCFPDTGTFVPIIANTIVSWCRTLAALAEDDSNSEWTEELLEKLSRTQALCVVLEVIMTRAELQCKNRNADRFEQVSDGRPSTSWIDGQNKFEIRFPKKGTFQDSSLVARFHDDLRVAFKPAKGRAVEPVTAAGEAPVELDGSDYDVASIMTPTTTDRLPSRPAMTESLPSIHTLARPEELFRKPPYHLIIYNIIHGQEMAVESSHQGSIELIAEYFKRWVKTNHNKTTKVCQNSSPVP